MVLTSNAYLVDGQVAQSVEQRTENPCVGGSIPPLATKIQRPIVLSWVFSFKSPAGHARSLPQSSQSVVAWAIQGNHDSILCPKSFTRQSAQGRRPDPWPRSSWQNVGDSHR